MINFDENNKYILEGTYQVSMSEKDMQYALKPVVLLNFMQDLAAKSIDKIDKDLSCDALLQKGLGWFLIRYRIEFDDYPIGVDKIKILTECRGGNRMTTYRDFECFNASRTQDDYRWDLAVAKIDIAKATMKQNPKLALSKIKSAKRIFVDLDRPDELEFAEQLENQIKLNHR